MGSAKKPSVGTILWHDLTVPNAPAVKDFYASVIGWDPEEFPMKSYSDYNMKSHDEEVVAGICHAEGDNADLPPQWLMYITVSNLKRSLEKCKKAGGKVLKEPVMMGKEGSFAVIQDPAGAVCALFEP